MDQILKKHTTSSAERPQKTETKKINFPEGLPGFPECHTFVMDHLREGFYDPLQLMISLDIPGLSFILYPHSNGHSLLSDSDYQEASKRCPNPKATVYSLVTVQEPNGHLLLTANLKAPIVIDQQTGTAWQYVLSQSPDQQFRVPLDTLSEHFRKKRKEAGIA